MDDSGHEPPAIIRLVAADRELLQRIEVTREFERVYRADVSLEQARTRAVVEQGLEFYQRIGAMPPWTGYLAVDTASQLVIGSCGFKGSPTPEGEVEIAYCTFPDYQGHGFASAMAEELVRIARDSGRARTIIAHTRTERNASVHILEKLGFRQMGVVVDPADGPVWRWRLSPGQLRLLKLTPSS